MLQASTRVALGLCITAALTLHSADKKHIEQLRELFPRASEDRLVIALQMLTLSVSADKNEAVDPTKVQLFYNSAIRSIQDSILTAMRSQKCGEASAALRHLFATARDNNFRQAVFQFDGDEGPLLYFGSMNRAVLQDLLMWGGSASIDLPAKKHHRETALMRAIQHQGMYAFKYPSLCGDAVATLLEAKAALDPKDERGRDALIHAVHCANDPDDDHMSLPRPECVEALLAAKANPKTQDNHGKSALQYARDSLQWAKRSHNWGDHDAQVAKVVKLLEKAQEEDRKVPAAKNEQ